MSAIPNEKMQSELLANLRERLNAVAGAAKEAINQHQPLGVSAKVGEVANVVGATAALGVQKVVTAKRTVSFFFNSVAKSFLDTRKQYKKLDEAYETMLRNLKAETTEQK